MNKVERSDFGRDILDTLDRVVLRDGETLVLEWPDQQQETVVIGVVSRSFERNDSDHTVQAWDSRAFVRRFHRGVQVEVPIEGLHARRAV